MADPSQPHSGAASKNLSSSSAPFLKRNRLWGLGMCFAKSPSDHDPVGMRWGAVCIWFGPWIKTWNIGHALCR